MCSDGLLLCLASKPTEPLSPCAFYSFNEAGSVDRHFSVLPCLQCLSFKYTTVNYGVRLKHCYEFCWAAHCHLCLVQKATMTVLPAASNA